MNELDDRYDEYDPFSDPVFLLRYRLRCLRNRIRGCMRRLRYPHRGYISRDTINGKLRLRSK